MKYSYNLLQEYFKQKLPKADKLAEILTLHSFEVESVSKLGKDYVFNIDVLPNRMPDCGGHFGVAREISAITNLKLKIKPATGTPRFKVKKLNKYLEVKVQEHDLCLRYTAAVMRNIKVGQTPKKLKEYLKILGINSINNVVDAANFIMLLTGQPLHVFDFDKIEDAVKLKSKVSGLSKQIIARLAKKGESITTLDNKKYDLDESMLVIADQKEPLALAGIKGGKKAEVDFNTKNIILEAANFNLTSIRKTSQKLNLRTDASIRFSYNLDPNLCEAASLDLVNLIKSFCGGDVSQFIDIYPKKIVPVSIKFDFGKARKILGVNIKDKDIKNIFQKLGFQIKSSGKVNIVYLPTVRRDINIEEDLIEEIGRVYGYEKIKPASLYSELIPVAQDKKNYVERLAKNFFVGQGFSEVYNYSFIGDNDLKVLEKAEAAELKELQNPLSSDMKFLRPALIFNILKNLSLNLKNYGIIKIFELGKVFPVLKASSKINPILFENNDLSATIAGSENSGELFFKLKGVISSLFEIAGVSGVKFDNSVSDLDSNFNAARESLFLRFCHPYRFAKIKIKGSSIGVIGEVRNDILTNYDIKKGTVVFFEIDFNSFLNFAREEKEFKPFSKFPAVSRDLSLFVAYETRIEEIENIIENEGGKFLVNCEIFDIYEPGSLAGGDEKLENRKSLAFRLTFQSEDKTLLDEEVDRIMEKIIKALEENLEWEVRK